MLPRSDGRFGQAGMLLSFSDKTGNLRAWRGCKHTSLEMPEPAVGCLYIPPLAQLSLWARNKDTCSLGEGMKGSAADGKGQVIM